MRTDETSRLDENLTDGNSVQESEQSRSAEPSPQSELPEGAKNWQHALQMRQERIKELERQNKEYARKEKEASLSDLTEAEKYKTLYEEQLAKNSEQELRNFVDSQIQGRNIPSVIRQHLLQAPWSIPGVSAELPNNFSVEEAIPVIKKHLPAYLDAVAVSSEPTTPKADNVTEPENTPSDANRPSGVPTVKNRVYTRADVKRLSDEGRYKEHEKEIDDQLRRGIPLL